MIKWVGSKIEYFKAKFKGDVEIDGNLNLHDTSIQAIQEADTAFSDNDTSLMTSAAIDDRINTKYANSIISFAGQATMEATGNWVMPGKSGISNHTWNLDSGVNTETNEDSQASIDRRWAHNGVRVPFACIVDGISCTISNADGNRQTTVGLFFARAVDDPTMPTWGSHTGNVSVNPVLHIHADANNEGGSYSGRPSHAEVTGADVAVAAGDLFYPAIKLTGITETGSDDNIYATFNVHIKTLIT